MSDSRISAIKRMRDSIAEPEFVSELQEAISVFRADARVGIEEFGRQDFASPSDASVIESRLRNTSVLPSVEHRSYRDAIYVAWSQMVAVDSFSASAKALQDSVADMCEAQIGSFSVICQDFELLFFGEERFREVSLLIESLIRDGQCGKALKVIRSNARFLGFRYSARCRARIWARLSRIDRRFDAISDRYSRLAGLGGDVLFKSDRPAEFSTQFLEHSAEHADLDFRSEIASAIESYESNPTTATKTESLEIQRKLRTFEGMKHFDSESFRSYLLAAWHQLLDDASSPSDVIDEGIQWSTLSSEQQRIADELISDFSCLVDNAVPNDDELKATVQNLIQQSRLAEALRQVRNAVDSSSIAVRATLLGAVWHEIARVASEPRFREIGASFKEWASRCSWEAT